MSKDGIFRTAVAAGGTMLAPSWVWAQQSSEPYRYGYGPHMMDWAGGWYGMIFGPLFMILVLVLVIALAVLVVRWLGGPWYGTHVQPGRDTARYPQGAVCARRDRQGGVRGPPPRAWRLIEPGRTRMNAPIYLDYNATTPVAPEVADAMLPFLREHFGNPSSSHPYGRFAAQAVAQARSHVAALIGARDDEIIFTGCATEANNLALLGVAQALRSAKRHLVVSAIEHPAVLAPATHLEAEGWSLSVVPVDRFGLVSPDEVARAIRPDTALVSVMHANNEVGTIQPIAEIARITRARDVLLHTDAAQTAGKIGVDVDTLGVDLLTLAGHKFYAPKGVGALYVRRGTPLRSISFGAEHERGLRPGTENVPAIVGLGVAARLGRERLPQATARLRELRDRTPRADDRSDTGARIEWPSGSASSQHP